jgi:superfamily II DNA or RNA helicase
VKLRPYQTRAVELIYSYFTHNTGNPVLEAPTAAGKSVIQAQFIKGVLDNGPTSASCACAM